MTLREIAEHASGREIARHWRENEPVCNKENPGRVNGVDRPDVLAFLEQLEELQRIRGRAMKAIGKAYKFRPGQGFRVWWPDVTELSLRLRRRSVLYHYSRLAPRAPAAVAA